MSEVKKEEKKFDETEDLIKKTMHHFPNFWNLANWMWRNIFFILSCIVSGLQLIILAIWIITWLCLPRLNEFLMNKYYWIKIGLEGFLLVAFLITVFIFAMRLLLNGAAYKPRTKLNLTLHFTWFFVIIEIAAILFDVAYLIWVSLDTIDSRFWNPLGAMKDNVYYAMQIVLLVLQGIDIILLILELIFVLITVWQWRAHFTNLAPRAAVKQTWESLKRTQGMKMANEYVSSLYKPEDMKNFVDGNTDVLRFKQGSVDVKVNTNDYDSDKDEEV